MEVIQSFTIDHTHLKPGIYVSREDKGFTTFDLRITEPNKEPAVAPAAMHSIEHLMATWFRNSQVKDDVVYVGPMGCLTGVYIIMTGNVWEWCRDWWSEDFGSDPLADPEGPSDGMKHVDRGGSWNKVPSHCRLSFRYGLNPDYKANNLGFRVVCVE